MRKWSISGEVQISTQEIGYQRKEGFHGDLAANVGDILFSLLETRMGIK